MHTLADLRDHAINYAEGVPDISPRKRERIMLAGLEAARSYHDTAQNLRAMGCVVSFSDETETTGRERDGTPCLFANVDAGPLLRRRARPDDPMTVLGGPEVIWQGPARELARFAYGLGWGLRLQLDGETI